MREDLKHPVPAVGAIILRNEEILLIKRGHEPGIGRWSVPGGSVELGETLEEAVKREVREETGLEIEVRAMAGVTDLIVRDGDGIAFHYVLIDYFASAKPGKPVAASDADECKWVKLAELGGYDVTETLVERLREWSKI